MTKEEYIKLFHKAEVNLVAFKPVFHCDDELRKMVEMAIEKEREAIEKRVMELDETMATRVYVINKAIREMGQE
jgi:hypothetical protein